MTLLSLDRIACLRGHRLLFEGLSATIGTGGALVVTGSNGIGKSSLLRIAAGLLAPSAGRAARGGAVAWLGEAAALDGERTLAAALRFWARLDDVADDMLDDAMAAMGVAGLADVPVRYLSTGQRRRAAIARIVAGGRPLWLLDEPANGLDAEGCDALALTIAAHRARGGGVMAATHLMLAIPGADTLELGGAA